MGYGRSDAALVDAVERGIKYGRKTGKIEIDDFKRFVLTNNSWWKLKSERKG